MDKRIKLEWLNPETLKPNPMNWRTHPERQKKVLDAVLSEVGWAGVALFNKRTGHLIDGHARREWAIENKTEMPVLVGEWDEKDEKKILATLDPIAAMAEQTNETLLELLDGLESNSEEFLKWASESINLLTGPDLKAGLTDADDVPKEPEKPVSVLGDLWVLGNHRLICGDSTQADTVSKLLGPVKPHLMVTDPPYGVEYDADWRNKAARTCTGMGNRALGAGAIGKVLNDNKADWREAWALAPCEVAYVWCAPGPLNCKVHDSLVSVGFEPRMQIVWAKNQLVIGRGHYHAQHENCWYAVKKNATGHWTGDRKQSTLWQIDKPRKSETGHSTQKPVECMRRPMENNSSPGQAIYEPFSGSGTTIIAGEQIGRHIYAIELNPAYIDMAIMRWQNFTGNQAVLDGDGRTFDEISKSRINGEF
jgi:DNA modification methylase